MNHRRNLLAAAASAAAAAANCHWQQVDASGSQEVPGPEPPDEKRARKLIYQWAKQEMAAGYAGPDVSWPPREILPRRDEIPQLRAAFARCGGRDQLLDERRRTPRCDDVSFRLAASLCGTQFGHPSEDEPSATERAEGAELMHLLADAGVREGACGFAYLLQHGELVQEDGAMAARHHQHAASAGYAQSMHELGTMFYLGEHGLPQDRVEAVRWFRRAATHNISGSMFLLGECLLAGDGAPQDVHAALGWFAAAGELGHRGARSRLISQLGLARTTDGVDYHHFTGTRLSRFVEWARQ